MKGYKCPKCGELHLFNPMYCLNCDYSMIMSEEIEIVDWEQELLTKVEENEKSFSE